MRSYIKFLFRTTSILLFPLAILVNEADASELKHAGKVTITDKAPTTPVDPENPETIVDPGPSPATTDSLRIDYVSSLDFGTALIKSTDRNYKALAQNFNGKTEPRGNYIQISDRREIKSGWTLQVKQTSQFRNEDIQVNQEKELTGAVLSLDKGWANSITGNPKPEVFRNTITLSNIGQSYEVATAKKDSGKGIWTIAFGASKENQNGQSNTLSPLVDPKGQPIIDSSYNKTVYSNSAITLNIPDSIKIYPVTYQTELTWILSEFP